MIEAFPLIGVVLTEVAPSNDTDYGRRSATRVINFVVRGRCQTFNLWSGKRPAGTPVFMIVKKRRLNDGKYSWVFEPYPGPGQPTSWQQNSPMDYHTARPLPEDLCWVEKLESGEEVIGVGEAVHIGTLGANVGDVALDPNTELYKQGLFIGANGHMMPATTELFVRI